LSSEVGPVRRARRRRTRQADGLRYQSRAGTRVVIGTCAVARVPGEGRDGRRCLAGGECRQWSRASLCDAGRSGAAGVGPRALWLGSPAPTSRVVPARAGRTVKACSGSSPVRRTGG